VKPKCALHPRESANLEPQNLGLRQADSAFRISAASLQQLNCLTIGHFKATRQSSGNSRHALSYSCKQTALSSLITTAGGGVFWRVDQALSLKLNDIERIDRMIATAEGRRNAILREVDRHRTVWGQNLRQAVQQIEAAEVKVIDAQPDTTRTAA
jgi:hypothetical protein